MSDAPVTLTISGRLAYDDQITIRQATQIIEFLNSDEATTLVTEAAGRRPVQGATSVTPQPSVPRAALDESGAKTNSQKIVALAAGVLRDGGGETFQLEAVKVQFQRAREPVPKNLSRDLSNAIAAGWVAEAETRGEYYLTQRGYEALSQGFSDETAPRTPRRTKPRSSSTAGPKSTGTPKGAKPAGLANIDVFSPIMPDIEPYHRMPSQKDKLLWALHFAQENGVKGITNIEAAWLTNELGEGISSKHLTARFELLRRSNYANRSTTDSRMRITPDGVEFLKSIRSKRA